MIKKIKTSLIFICLFFVANTLSQKKIDPWKKLVEENNCKVSFIFYKKADNYNNGIVIKIENKNKFRIKYKFTIIAKTEKIKKEKFFNGILKGFETITGSSNHLFWIPKLNGLSITEVGITKWKFVKSQ